MRKSLLAGGARSVINVGVEAFAESVRQTGGRVQQGRWPPGDGEPELAWALAQLASDTSDTASCGACIDAANALAVERIVAAQPVLVDVALHART